MKLKKLLFALALSSLFSANILGQADPSKEDLGIFVQLVKIRVRPVHSGEWEKGVSLLAKAAKASDVDEQLEWLMYRAEPAVYNAVTFSDELGGVLTLGKFPGYFKGEESQRLYSEALRHLAGVDYEITENMITQMDYSLSTVREMSTSTHLEARTVEYWVKPGKEREFLKAVRDRVVVLKSIEYPYPVEGGRYALFAPGRFLIATFPDNWADFYGKNDLRRLAEKKGALERLQKIESRIESTLIRSESHDISYARELSN
ncbi:MAG TPA: hypothetical protein VMM38_15150 [Aridibacter sp.]|nr:hypothetical protein [Aridibacter sp.]